MRKWGEGITKVTEINRGERRGEGRGGRGEGGVTCQTMDGDCVSVSVDNRGTNL